MYACDGLTWRDGFQPVHLASTRIRMNYKSWLDAKLSPCVQLHKLIVQIQSRILVVN